MKDLKPNIFEPVHAEWRVTDSVNALIEVNSKTTVYVSKEFADKFRSPPKDGRVFIVQDARRPWVHHVTHANGKYSRFDAKNSRIPVSIRIICDGKKHSLQSKYAPSLKPRCIEKCKAAVTDLSVGELPIQMIDLNRVMAITGFKKSYIYAQISVDFPSPIRLGNSRRSAARWILSEVVSWVKSLADKRSDKVSIK